MGRGKNISEMTKMEILRMSRDGASDGEIADAVGVNKRTVNGIICRHRSETIRECASCGKTIKDVEAVFCPYCGKKILTEKDRVMEHLNDIGKCVGEFPNSFRDRIMANVNEIRKYIKGH